ncbi:hypothetical protein ACGGZK_06925 [Agromyces sp. MMS24-K17]|uniref:COG1470 family protein n=1 Tax=Agromyces sp. MMS24-K17 TaxID=3372850 RepID=UPI003754339C
MAERVCEVCGTTNDASARFCRACNSYLGWDSGAATLDGEPLAGSVPTVVDSVITEQDTPPVVPVPAETGEATADAPAEASTSPAPTAPPGAATPPEASAQPGASGQPAAPVPTEASATPPPAAPGQATAPAATAAPARVEAPEASFDATEVLLTPDAPATATLRLVNPSSIVDGYDVVAVDPPAWLVFEPGDAHLMPAQELAVPVRLALREGVLVFAQRLVQPVRIRSQADPTLVADAALDLTVPPVGPSVALEVRPSLIRLEDHAAGEFTVRLDNRAANFPQTVRLSAADSEALVRFAFAPAVVTAPPGQAVEVRVSFTAPEPEPGRELSRQITVEASNDAGRTAVPVTIVQRTAAVEVDAPVRARVEPSAFRIEHGATGDFDVLIDHRGGHHPVTVTLSGRDPARSIGFAFSSAQVVLQPGEVERVRGRLSAPLPARGETETYPFTIVVSDGVHDTEAPGSVELSSPPEPILVAALAVDPPSQLLVNERQGTFHVAVDNRRGVEPLVVRLEGASDDGAACCTFTPTDVAVPPGTIGGSRLVVDAPRPDPGQSATRRLRIVATDGVRAIEAHATFTQASADRRPIAGRVLVILGGILAIVGALVEWFAGFTAFLPSIDLIAMVARAGVSLDDIALTEPAMRTLVIFLAALMLLGLVGRSGRLTRVAAILIVLFTAGWLVFLAVVIGLPPLGLGLILVWIGAVLGFIGGILVRSRQR